MVPMFPGGETEVEGLRRRHKKALAFARTDPEHALLEVRKVTETVCAGIVSAASVEVRARRGPPTLDEIVTVIEQRKLVPPLVAKYIRALQFAGNYGAHAQEDKVFLSPAWAAAFLAQLDAVLGWYMETRWGVTLEERSVELSGLTSLQALIEDGEGHGTDGTRPDANPVPGERAERRSSPRPPAEPRTAEEWLERAERHERRGETAIAARACDRAIYFFLRRSDLGSARLIAGRVTRMLPGSGDHWIQLGEVLVTDGAIPEAVVALRRAATLFEAARDPVRRVAVCERIVALAPTDVGTLHVLAKTYLSLGDLERALRTISRCLPLGPREPETLRILAESFDRLGHADKAAQVRAVATATA